MTKQNEIDEITTTLDDSNFENLFNLEFDSSGSYYYNILKSASFPEELDSNSYTEYVSVPGDTWPYIAWKHYEDVKLWWTICLVNNIINPVAQPEPGTILKILNPDIVAENLLEAIANG